MHGGNLSQLLQGAEQDVGVHLFLFVFLLASLEFVIGP